jgi:predicted MFS family arabinose efflux permease
VGIPDGALGVVQRPEHPDPQPGQPAAELMGAAVNQSAMNVANSLGAALGGVVIARGYGYLAPTWVGVALAVGGLGLAALSFATERRSVARAALISRN